MKNIYSSDLRHSNFDAIIIGSGVGGLSTAAFLSKAGKKVLVLEKHYVTGGFTHTFKRKNFIWDVGVHYVGQVHSQNNLLRKVFDYVTDSKLQWADMGDVYDQAIIDGDVYNFRRGFENQINQMIAYFPEEAIAIRAYYNFVKKVSGSSIMFFSEKTMPAWLSKTAGYFLRKGFYKNSVKTTREVLTGFTTNEKLISVLCAQCGNYGLTPERSSFAIHALIVDHFIDGGNYPVGGASSIHKYMTETIESYGGKVVIRASVKNILIEKNTAIGVELENGDTVFAKKIISNAGAHNTFNQLIPDSYRTPKNHPEINKIEPSISHVCLYVGLNASDADLKLPKNNIWLYKDYNLDANFEQHINNEPKVSPVVYISFPSAKDTDWEKNRPGTATIQVIGSFPFSYLKKWENLQWKKRGAEYEEIKEEVKDYLLKKLLSVVPQIKNNITYLELSTPLSTKYFTGYSRGEIYGLEHTPERFKIQELRPVTKYKNLYLTGQDIVCVGVGAALFSGLITAVSILNKNLFWTILRYKKSVA
ncbi:MAG: NAD(P)/FAD-dependent oxidoreductase [Bacteroidetes bacterium]|nr:NAD(P)/FAD-dependent oxidoreductase [Bacteroidota bacterium]